MNIIGIPTGRQTLNHLVPSLQGISLGTPVLIVTPKLRLLNNLDRCFAKGLYNPPITYRVCF